jgi:hypothetical protein
VRGDLVQHAIREPAARKALADPARAFDPAAAPIFEGELAGQRTRPPEVAAELLAEQLEC